MAAGCAVAAESSFRLDQADSGDSDRHIRVSFGSASAGSVARGAEIIGTTATALSPNASGIASG